MAIKAVFFDIDGTLLMDNRTVSKSTIFSINSLKENGILVGLATGRDPRFVMQYMVSLGLDLGIAYNGQYIFSRDKVLYSHALDVQQIEQIMKYAQKYHKDLSFGTATGVMGSKIMSVGSGKMVYRLTRLIPSSWAGVVNFIFNRLVRQFHPQKQINLQHLLLQPIYQMMLLTTEKETKKLAAQFSHLSFNRSSPYATDIISKGNSKFVGISRVARFYHFDLDEVMVFGDSNNDLEMLEGINHSVAMGNGTLKAKQAASFVTDTNNQDGIYKALLHFKVIGEKNVPK